MLFTDPTTDPTTEPGDASSGTAQVVRTRTSRMWIDREGVVHDVNDPGSEQVLADAVEKLTAGARLLQGRRPPLLVDMSAVRSVSREARNFYAGEEVARAVCAIALVVRSPLSRMIGNFFLGLNKLRVPVRLFSSTEDAMAWLREFLPSETRMSGE